ncbi:MAG: hypothetical protein HY852_02055 [Bradyrhizobium sp.]|uniref:hypothetical protein n=1 Tax=Bradyrhizobium sp. TaxID=376 RepID=UPI0025BC5E2B|nr:hypothetical protein [Bradyrhizobium sp.]MBI5260584.1 hypothetical protein [Bradyrhizobium sp.]
MVLKSASAAIVFAVLAWGGVAAAADYRPDEYLGLDLSKALLSPKRLGPPAQFAPVPVEARADSRVTTDAQPRVEPKDAPRKMVNERVRGADGLKMARPESRRGSARTKLAHRHSNPLDARAMDTRVQVWPCRSGGICSWKR